MRGILGKFNLRKINLGKISSWKFYRKLAVILAVLLVFQSMPIKAEQSGQVYENAADTEEETVQGEDENRTGKEGEGGNVTGSEGEGDGNGTGSEGDGNGTGSEGEDGTGNEGGGSGEEGGNEGDGSGSETLELEFQIPEPEPQVYHTDGKFINKVRSKDGAELSGVTIQYIIDNTEIASIDSDTGEVTFLKAGTVIVTAEVTEKTPTEEVTTEGGTTEGGTIEGETTEGGTTEGETTEGETTEEGTTEEGTTEGGTTEGETTEEGTTEGGTTTDEDKNTITSISYTLVIEKAPQTIAFEKSDQNFLYGQYFTFSNCAKEVGDDKEYGDGKITYKVVSGEDLADIDEETGDLTFKDKMTGSVTVEAVKAEDDCYKQSDPVQYTVTVAYEQTPETPYTLSGIQSQDADCADWYSGQVTICPPEEYLISDNNCFTDTEWRNNIVLEKDGIYDDIKIYIRNKTTKAITDAVQVEVIRIDQTAPVDLKINYDTPLIEKVKELLSFGFYKAKLEITLKAQDDLSGVSSFTYWLDNTASGDGANMESEDDTVIAPEGDTAVDPENDSITKPENGIVVKAEKHEDGFYYGTFTIEPQFKGRVIFTATDGAGNKAGNITSNGIVIDDKASKLSVHYEMPYVRALSTDVPGVSLTDYKEGNRTDVNLYYVDGLTLGFTIKEENFFPEDVVVKVNGEVPAESLTWTQNADGDYEASLELKDEGAYVVTLSYEDRSQNGKVEYTSERIIIDATPPELKVGYGSKYVKASSVDAPSVWLDNYTVQSRTDVNLYYAGTLVLDFTIKEENFYEEDVEVKVNGETRTLTWGSKEVGSQKYAAANLELKDEGAYVVTLSYEDRSQNGKVEYTSEHIIIDTTSPELKVEYGNKYVKASSVDAPSVWLDNYMVQSRTDVNLYYAGGLVLDFTIKEENFYHEKVEIKVNGESRTLTWGSKEEGNQKYATANLELKDEGEYVVTLSYEDPSQNGKVEYTSEHIVIDTTPAELNVKYGSKYVKASSVDAPSDWLDNYTIQSRTDVNLYYAGILVLDFTIKEENFYQEEVEVKVNGEKRTLTWVSKEEGSQKYATTSLELKDEGEYVVTLSYEDPSQNGKVEYTSEHIVIDTTPPELNVEYGSRYVKASSVDAPSDWLDDYTVQSRTDVNLYYAGTLVLDFTIKEENFYHEEVEVKVNGKNRILTWVSKEEGGQKYATASLELKDEGEYVVTLSYEDPSQKGKVEYTSEHFIIDATPPELNVEYGSRYVKASSVDAPGVPLENYVEWSEENVNLYYDNDVVLNFTIEEQNFFKEDVQIEVNGKPCTLTWMPVTNGSRSYTASLELKDEGAYVVSLHYQDPSGYEAAKYTSEHIILDKSDPKIQVTYDGTEPVTGTSDIYDQTRTATIKITDKNIYPNDGEAVSVKITAKDALGANVDFTPNCQFVKTPKKTDNPDEPDEWEVVISYDVSANYTFEIIVEDMAGRKASYGTDSFTVDITKPDTNKFSIDYSKDYKNWFEKILGAISFGYYRPSVTITFKAEDETTSIVGMEWIYTRRNEESTAEPENETGIITEDQLKRVGNQVIAEITLTADEAAQYRGNIAFKAMDKAGNESYYKTDQDNVIVVDTITPTRTARYSPAKQVTDKTSGNTIMEYGGQIGNTTEDLNEIENLIEGIGAVLYYDNAMTLTLEMREANFYAEDVKVYVYRDGQLLENGDGYHYEAKSNWMTSEKDINEHKMTLQLGTENADSSRDGDYVVVVSYSDRSGNEMPVYTSEQITIDTRKPVLDFVFPENAVIRDGIVYLNENPSLEVIVSERNFRAGEVSVTVTAKDAYGNEIPVGAGKDANGEEVTYAQYFSDAANWTSIGDEHRASVLLAEDARYEFVVSYCDLAMQRAEEVRCIVMLDRKSSEWEDIPYDKAYTGDLARMVDGLGQRVEHVEDADQDTRFLFQGEVTLTVGLDEENFFPEDVEIVVERDGVLLEPGTGYHYTPQDWTVDNGDSTRHTLHLVLGEENVDHVADGDYQVKVSYTDTSGNVSEQYLSNVLTIDTTAPVISVEYDNNEPYAEAFYGKNRTAVITVTDRNIRTDEIDIRISGTDTWGNTLETVSAKIGNWVPGEEEGSWKNTITYDMDANYDIEILCPDMAGNQSLFTDGFTIDKEFPGLRYEYSNSLMETALNFITFGFYQPDVTVTVYIQEDIAGVDYLIWGYEKEAESSSVNVENKGGTIHRSEFSFETTEYGVEAKASFRLTANEAEQYRGRIRFEVADRAGNIKRETDGGRIIVVDTISPTRTVTYSPAVQVADRQNGTILTDYAYQEGADTILYYDGPMEVAFQINEANFYAEDVIFKVNDEVVQVSNWNRNGDIWSGSLSLYEDGDYIFTMEYTDRSGNGMVTYTSSQITIDTIIPLIETNWAMERLIQTKENINYSQEDMEVTIVIHERNFRAQDVEAVVTAVDAAGLDVPVDDYTGYLKDDQNWTRDGDLHTAVLDFPTDANYTFTIQFQDLVFHSSEEYEPYAFTVDKTPPTGMTIDYSTPVLESILNAITFGFYNIHSTVTITAVDDTSGVDHFIYSFLRAEDVSNVNTELINAQIEESDITYSEGRKIATASFRIPNSELGENTQFNGTVEFSAIDRTQLETKLVDGKRVVVDTIAPVAELQYNEPVSMDGDTSYYDGTIEGVINVTEANFYAEDVNLFVSKDGGAFEALTPAWTLLGMDRNAGAFTLTGDGEYIVSAVYTDRSTNQMVEYQSDLLVIDTGNPQISVSGIRNRSANRDETIGFVVTVRDENLDPASCHPKLMAEVCDDVNGGTVFREIDMLDAGTTNTVHNGGEYVYTYVVENLDRDGIYTLSCEAADRAGHSVTEVSVEDSRNGRPGQDTEQMTEQVMFSVNRNGSTYSLNQESRNIIGIFTNAPIDIVVTEINPDILNVIRITLFRDEKTLVLQEGTDYRIDRTGGDGEWNSYVYTIFAENFENDGVYRISVYSEDEAENVAENTLDNKNLEISFGIDKTPPNLIVTNLESNQTYNEDSHTVNMQAEDNMKLVSVEVWLDGEPYMSWDKDEVLRKMTEYEDYSFVVSGESTRAHNVTVALTDAAGNRLVEEISDFYVTTNFWLILWRQILDNKPLLFSIIAGVTGIVAIPIGIVVLRRRRKDKSNAGA